MREGFLKEVTSEPSPKRWVPLNIQAGSRAVLYLGLRFEFFLNSLHLHSLPSAVRDSEYVIWFCVYIEIHSGFLYYNQISSVQLLSPVRLFTTPWICSTPGFPVHHQLRSSLKLNVHQVGDTSNRLILCRLLLLLPSVFRRFALMIHFVGSYT